MHAGWILIGAGAGLVPWAGLLARRGSLRWAVFDVVEAAGLVSAGWFLTAGHTTRARTACTVSAALLVGDAVVDVATAKPGTRPVAIALAVGAELPLAALCLRAGCRR